MHQNIVAPLLNDSRLTLPGFESSKFAVFDPRAAAMALGGLKTHFHAAGGGARGVAAAAGAAGKQVGKDALEVAGNAAKTIAPRTSGKVVGAIEHAPTAIGNAMDASAAKRDSAFAGGRAATNPSAPQPAAPLPAAGAEPVAAGAPGLGNTLSKLTGMKAMGLGAAAGGLKGLVDPGTEYDANGVPHQKSRIGAMVGGAATGAAAGVLAAPLIRAGARAHQSGALALPPVAPSGQFNRVTGEIAPKVASKISHLLPSIDATAKTAMLPGGLDATANNAVNGPGGTNTMSVPKVATMAHLKEDMSKGVPSAKAEEKDRTKRVEVAKKMGTLDPMLNPAIGAKPSAKDKKDAKPAFPNLNLKKK